MASSWGTSWLTSWADSWGAVSSGAEEAPVKIKRGGPPPGAYARTYLPPGKWTKKEEKEAVDAVKALYKEARTTIPETLQVGLLPESLTRTNRAYAALPPMSQVDFAGLARSLETIQVLIAAINAQHEARLKRRRDEDALINILVDLI